ncbi:MAG: metal-sensing transcriptional repressor [Breznakia sp.]
MHADQKQIARLLKTARGQIDGILKMVEEDQYCIDISNQIMASIAILNKTNREILKGHMQGCIYDSFHNNDEAYTEKKIKELIKVFEKVTK